MYKVVQNIAILFWKLLAYACHTEILDILACLMATLNVETALPLDVLRRPMESAVIPIYAMDGRSWIMIG
jgi:hypothetical protein